MRTARPLICIALFVSIGCNSDDGSDAGDGDINDNPTGSITTPSVCDRVGEDVQLGVAAVDSFALLWVDDHYLLAFADQAGLDIYVAQLDAAGGMLGAPIAVETGASSAHLPSLARTASGFLVAWQDDAATSSVRARALDGGGAPIGEVTEVAKGRGGQMRPNLSSSPFGTAVAWMDQAAADADKINVLGDSTTWVAGLDEAGRLLADYQPRQVHPGTLNGFPWLSGDDGRLALLWSDGAADRTDTFFSTFDAALAMEGPTNVRGADSPTVALLGRMIRTEYGYLAAWEDQRNGLGEIYMSILDEGGGRHAGGLVEEPETGDANWPHLAWTGTSSGIVYYQFRNGRPQIFLTFIDADGARVGGGADAQVSNSPAWARFPDVVWTGGEFGVAWLDARTGQQALFFNRMTCKKEAAL